MEIKIDDDVSLTVGLFVYLFIFRMQNENDDNDLIWDLSKTNLMIFRWNVSLGTIAEILRRY